MARLAGVGRFVCVAIAVAWVLGGKASSAEPLRVAISNYLGPKGHLNDDEARGPDIEVLRQVFAAMGRDVSFWNFPPNRIWGMFGGEIDGRVGVLRTSEREKICSFPDEPTRPIRVVFFIRTADLGKLKFSSFDDLVGHDVAVEGPDGPGSLGNPTVSPELSQFLREHHNMVETYGTTEGIRMLAAGRVDYAASVLDFGSHEVTKLGLSGKVEPLLSRSVMEGGEYVCFSKASVAPAFVTAFSDALKTFKKTDAYQVIRRKYFPEPASAQ